MTLKWEAFVSSLGEPEASARLTSLLSEIGELPVVSQTPEEYNDPTGTTRYYKFLASGLELGIRNEQLNHIHFFIQGDEGYGSYTGPLPPGIASGVSEGSVVKSFGPPAKSGGDKPSPLLGFVHKWIKYDVDDRYSIRFEFSREGKLRRLTLIHSAT